ncbi:uncharacterized protein HaLaN_28178 [Haematococcus lacustris]|uniref:Uncharacterized protein n=1 Tax=Haematococcus lacustris TaxID=44745 RepID=A0A6A0ABS9_HAELA|nr:uncharacterized protein HaLaN_28178 [Haematococcus lacustris]
MIFNRTAAPATAVRGLGRGALVAKPISQRCRPLRFKEGDKLEADVKDAANSAQQQGSELLSQAKQAAASASPSGTDAQSFLQRAGGKPIFDAGEPKVSRWISAFTRRREVFAGRIAMVGLTAALFWELQRCPALPLEVFAAATQPPPCGPAAGGPGPGPGVAQQWALRCAEELAAGTAAAQLSRTAQPGLSSWHRLLPLDHITRCWQPFLDRGLLGWAAVLAGADEPDHHSAAFFRGLPPMPLWPFTASRLLSAKELAALPLERMECAAGPQNSGNAQLKKHEAEVTAYAMPDARTLFDSWRRATALPGKTPDFTDYKVAAEKVLRDAAMLPNEATRDSVTGDERASHGAPHLLVLDVSQAGNASRFVRHSNEANLTAQAGLPAAGPDSALTPWTTLPWRGSSGC